MRANALKCVTDAICKIEDLINFRTRDATDTSSGVEPHGYSLRVPRGHPMFSISRTTEIRETSRASKQLVLMLCMQNA